MSLRPRRLTPNDWAAYKAIRLRALKEEPDAFQSSYDVEKLFTDEAWQDRLKNSFTVGAFDGIGELAGVASLIRGDKVHTRHHGTVGGVYVVPEARHVGLGDKLLLAIIAEAEKDLHRLYLKVNVARRPAVSLYKRYGFEVYGIEPRRTERLGITIDQYMMVKRLTD